ncbi:hypothetical protein [Trueperella bialowiezensis]|uniref:Cell division protein FtsL n=1 Tax=Trueperella bialowiezensis TaxID=312285 RepID=A0A3S4VEV2_9ACTO|nr:hypothetical protein [Trueperella bialowiezensis]VEI12607.1 Uncharacterised protein [Trueperella bialowiezensis]
MSTAAEQQRQIAPNYRPVIQAPGLSVVPTPAPARSFISTVFVCIGLVVGAVVGAFHLNTLMIQGAYDVKNISVELNEMVAREATLKKDVLGLSTPGELRVRADALGLVPAQGARHVNLETGVITAPAGK